MLFLSLFCLIVNDLTHTITISKQNSIVGVGVCLADLLIYLTEEFLQFLFYRFEFLCYLCLVLTCINHVNQSLFKQHGAITGTNNGRGYTPIFLRDVFDM